MPARRDSPKLRALGGRGSAEDATVRDARLGGQGVDWDEVPEELDDRGRAEWRRLGDVFRGQPLRFREGDRDALFWACAFHAQGRAAAADVAARGVMVAGRHAEDRDRLVKNPSVAMMREAATQYRYWARELGLTPDARGRIGVDEGGDSAEDDAIAARFLS